MAKRENIYVESYKALRALQAERAQKESNQINESVSAKETFKKQYHSIIESREAKLRVHSQLVEACRNDAFATALKAIFITALEAGTLTDNGIILAESMVDNWIKENGGAEKIMNEHRDQTYFLSRLAQIVEDAAQDEVKEIEDEDDEKESDESKEEKVEDNKSSEDNKDDEDDDKDEDDSDDDHEESEDEDDDSDDEEDESKVEEPKTEEEPKADPLNTTFEDEEEVEVPDDATTDEDDNESDTAEDIVDDLEEVPEEDITIDGDNENKGRVFDELEKEEDVRKAIELIRQRIADAEETFIKRNAEDKKQVDELIGRISDNVKTVEDMDDEASAESKIAQESARLNRRRITQITENRPLSILEKMTRSLTKSITKDQVLREQYLTEDGNMDMHLVVESAKIMYGFMETLNTLQLEKVDSKYIQKVLEEM